MVCFQTKNTNLGKFWRALDRKILIYFMAIWNILRTLGIHILWPFGTICVHLVHFYGFGIMHQEKSGNPESDTARPFISLSDLKASQTSHCFNSGLAEVPFLMSLHSRKKSESDCLEKNCHPLFFTFRWCV
jgi:hypothetical protein